MSLRLRHIAEVNPATPEFDRLPFDAAVTFMPLEAVWPDARLDMSSVRPKSDVATGYTRFRDGDVLVPKVTPTFQAGRSAVVGGLVNGVGAGSTELHVLRARPGQDAGFVRYVALSAPFLTEGVAAFQGVAGLQRVPGDFVKNYAVRAFPVEEQCRIAHFLDGECFKLDKLVTKYRMQTELILEYQKSATAHQFKAASSLAPVRLKNLLARRPRYGVLVPEFSQEGVPLIRVNDMANLDRRVSTLPRIPKGLSGQYRSTIVRRSDVLLSVVGTLGRVVVAPPEAVGSNVVRAIAVLRAARGVDVRLLASWLRGPDFETQAADVTGTDSAQPTLGMEDLSNFSLSWPTDSKVQDAMAARLRTIELTVRQALENVAGAVALLTERRNALITAAVTGEIDVSTARGVSV